jgi:hypothetical protein
MHGDDPGLARRRGFLESFIRPQGLDSPSTEAYVDAILKHAPAANAAPQASMNASTHSEKGA